MKKGIIFIAFVFCIPICGCQPVSPGKPDAAVNVPAGDNTPASGTSKLSPRVKASSWTSPTKEDMKKWEIEVDVPARKEAGAAGRAERRKDYKTAEQHLQKMIALEHGMNVTSYDWLSKVQRKEGKYKEALASYRHVAASGFVSNFGSDRAAMLHYAQDCARQGDTQAANEAYRWIIKNADEFGGGPALLHSRETVGYDLPLLARLAQGKTALHDGNGMQALVLLQSVAKQRPQSGMAQYYLGLALDGAGKKQEAMPHLRIAASSADPAVRAAASAELERQARSVSAASVSAGRGR